MRLGSEEFGREEARGREVGRKGFVDTRTLRMRELEDQVVAFASGEEE